MAYVDGFVAAVPSTAKDAYLDHGRAMAALFMQHGVSRSVECWGEDVQPGQLTDFRRAVQARDDETVVFAWMESPDEETHDRAMAAVMEDADAAATPMPFDGQRMIFGGFQVILDEGGGSGGFVDGFVLPVSEVNRAAYLAMAQAAAPVFLKHGAVRHVEAWGDDVPEGKVTDMFRAVQAQDGEVVVFSWIEWPDRATRDAGMAAAMADPAMDPTDGGQPPFDMRRMIYGGFAKLLDL